MVCHQAHGKEASGEERQWPRQQDASEGQVMVGPQAERLTKVGGGAEEVAEGGDEEELGNQVKRTAKGGGLGKAQSIHTPHNHLV